MAKPEILYEARYVVAGEVHDEFEVWLRGHRDRAQIQDGMDDVRGFETPSGGAVTYTFRYRIADDDALDTLLNGFFDEVETSLLRDFGDAVEMRAAVLREDRDASLSSGETLTCLNCGTRLHGQYCGNCGQRARSRLISLWQLLKEAFGDLLELDSRLWRTLIPLLARPGKLTREYLEGRRVYYMPPFRMYLVLSVIFFVIAFFDPMKDLSVWIEPGPLPDTEQEAATVAPDENEDEDGIFGNCENVSFSDEEDMPVWMTSIFTDERLRQICERNKARGNDNIADAIIDNAPIALILLLPIMALVLKLLYSFSRRYFVEHLLFFIHFHAFLFLLLTLNIVFARIVSWTALEGTVSTIIIVAASLYVPIYLYKAMRRVYGEGHLITLLKYVLLAIAYITGTGVTLLATFLGVVLTA